MGKKPLPPLPWEIFVYILSFVPPSHLLSVILACQAFRRLAEPLLYRHIDLSNCPTRSLHLLRTLLCRKDLCRHVRTFQPADRHSQPDGYLGVFTKILRDRSQEHMRRTAYIQHVERAAGRLTYVENISVHTSSEQAVRALGGLSNVKRFRTLHPWGLRQHESLLDALPNVTHLELPFTSFFLPVSEIRPYHTRFVEELICPTNVAVRLVPGRPIKRLFLLWPMLQGPPNSFDLMKEMARSTETIKTLGLFVGWGWNWQGDMAQIVSAMATFLPDVEELTLKLKCWKSNSHILDLMLRELPDDLAALHKLRVLDFNGSAGCSVDYFDHRRNAISAVYARILQTWSDRCPTLEKVVFPNGAIWVKEATFQRHTTLIHSSTVTSRHSRSLSKLALSSFRRLSILSPPLSPTDITSLEDKDVLHLDHTLESADDTNKNNLGMPSTGHPPNNDAEFAITMRRDGSGSIPPQPSRVPPVPLTPTTSYKWRCLNPYLPRANRTTHSFFSRIQGAENWSTPSFKKDLNRSWPDGLWSGNTR